MKTFISNFLGGPFGSHQSTHNPLRAGLSAVSFKKENTIGSSPVRRGVTTVGSDGEVKKMVFAFLKGYRSTRAAGESTSTLKNKYKASNPCRIMVICILMLLLSQQIHATNIEVTNRKYLYTIIPTNVSSATSAVTAPNLSNITGGTASFFDKKATGYFQLGIDPDAMFCYDTNYVKVEVDVNITYKTLSGWTCGSNGAGSTLTTNNALKTLTIDFDPVNRQIYTEKARLLYANAYDISVEVLIVRLIDRTGTNIVVYNAGTTGTNFAEIPKDLYWETGIQLERYHDFNYNLYPSNFSVTLDVPSDQLVFNWAFQTGAEYYEIEYAYVNDYDATSLGTLLPTSSISTSFENNCSRVRLNNTITTYRIPNIFDRGYVIARIRGIGVKGVGTDGCPLNNEIPGFWSFEQTPGVFVLNTMPSTQFVQVNRHESGTGNNKNWKASISFAEDGKHKEIVEYADGSSRVRQSVTKLSSTNEAIVGETVYDHQGRPTIQVLPVPVTSSVVKYYDNFNLENASNTKFSREHFDTDNLFGSGCVPPAPQLSTTSGASYYYSTSNTAQGDQQAFVADAEKYPYTQVVYAPDNTGRIKMQSGVGDEHILGSGHETKYFYGKPSQQELDRLFGTNVGYKGHYQKNMVIDANGQVSISFLDMAGKTIATALAGSPVTTNLNPLEDPVLTGQNLYQTSAETLTVNLLGDITAANPNGEDNHLNPDGTVWSNTTPLLVESPQTYHFSYSTDLKDYLDACLNNVCFDCEYELLIDIKDACNASLAGFPYVIKLGGDDPDVLGPDVTCNEPNSFTVPSSATQFDANLQIGNYTVTKTLRLNEDVIGYYTQQFIENNTCLLTWEDFYEMPDTSGCFYSCDECLAALGTEAAFITQMQTLNPGMSLTDIELLYAEKKAGCDEICDDTGNDMCQAGYRMMLTDLKPGGQYAYYDVNPANPLTPADELSIFNIDPFLPDYTNGANNYRPGATSSSNFEAWRNPHFFDKNDPSNTTGLPTAAYLSPANNHYFEENGDTARVILIPNYGGGYYPQIVSGAPVYVNALNQFYTYPHFLLFKEDYISRATESWSRSLLVYHPEFLFYRECLLVSAQEVTIGSETYNTWEFDQLLQELDINTFPNPDLDPDVQAVMPTTYNDDFYFHEIDPFFTWFGNTPFITGIPTSTPSLEYGAMADALIVFPPYNLNLQESAYGLTECSISDPGFVLSDCSGFQALLTSSSTENVDYITTQQAWDMAIANHLSVKQQAFWKHIQFRVRENLSSPNPINNLCIGSAIYDPSGPWSTIEYWLPCDQVQYYRYANKAVRFGSPNSMFNNGTFNPPPPTPEQLIAYGQQQVYDATGKCPTAIDLQTFIALMHQDGHLDDASFPIEFTNYVSPVLRGKLETLNGNPLPNYQASIVGQTLTGTIGVNYFALTLPSGYSWANVLSITNVDDIAMLTSPDWSFTGQAQFLNGTTVEFIEFTGVTDIQIGNCEDELMNVCIATPESNDLASLMGALKNNGTFGNVGVNLATYDDYLTNIYPYFTTNNPSDFNWSKLGPGSYKLYTSTQEIQITITSGNASQFDPNSFEIASISGDIFVSPNVGNTSNFIITGYLTENDMLLGINQVIVTGTVLNGAGVNPFLISVCDEPTPADCQTLEHESWFELQEYLTTQPLAGNNPCIDDDLESSLPSTFDLISLEPDMDFSLDGVSSTHFILTILEPGETIPTVLNGIYCEAIRPCTDCDPEPVEPCDEIFYVLTLSEFNVDIDLINQGQTWNFNVSDDLGLCYPDLYTATFQPNTQMPGGPFTVENILDEWADYLNSISNGTYTATHPVGTATIIFQLNNVSQTECVCLPPGSRITQIGNFEVITRGNTNHQQFVPKYCCEDYDPIVGSGPELPEEDPDILDWEIQPTLTLGSPCDMNLTPFDIPPPVGNPCVEALLAAAQLNADNAYNNYLAEVAAQFRADYIAQCMSVTEDFQVEFINQQYHFTLYYYDQAGNLIKTVPPAAVKTIPSGQLTNVSTARNSHTLYLALHDDMSASGNTEALTTRYQYNTLNQPRFQRTPDGGQTQFYYDALGRLVFSQNAKQIVQVAVSNRYSYTVYDNLGRITEVGQLSRSTFTPILQPTILDLNVVQNIISSTNSSHVEITSTFYDVPYTLNPSIVQTELRNRVSFTTYRDAFALPVRSATYYSYDIHGNVHTLWNENKDVPLPTHQVKKMVYNYDLVSGKVNRVTFQPGEQDQWIHKYSYDADNRLTRVETSRDGVFYDRDASYFYYKHGPLARTEYGQLNVQGTDYAYTIHGWLKAVNATNLDPTLDMGHDAYPGSSSVGLSVHKFFAKDVYSYALHYYTDDYKNILNNTAFIGNITAINTSTHDLFNGNISLMQTTILNNENAVVPYLSRYKYDQLNRINEAKYDTLINLTTNKWTDDFTMGLHDNTFRYDANGNILNQQRNGMLINTSMDDLTYHYNPNTNQLSYVQDAVTSTYSDDIDSQSPNNYTYDPIGNLVGDVAEEINSIEWTVYGKVKKVDRSPGSQKDKLEFAYGPGGQRLTKTVTKFNGTITTNYYFYDASGNMMGIYKHESTAAADLYIEEQMMYGSSRIGSVILKEKLVPPTSVQVTYTQKRGQKRYELNNHLGNVLSTISDRRKLNCGIQRFEADLINTFDYSPFGAPMHGRSLGAMKCSNYTIHHVYQTFFDDFNGASAPIVPLTAVPLPATYNWYELNVLTQGYISSNRLNVQKQGPNTNNTRGVARQFNVLAGKQYGIRFKHSATSGNVLFYYRIVDNATSTVIVPQTGLSATGLANITSYNFANLFTPSANATYRIEFYMVGLTTNSTEFRLDDVEVFYEEDTQHTICQPTGGDYRFGAFNMEKVNEWQGTGNSYDFGARMHDARLGLWMSVDPYFATYPSVSPYAFSGNSPIMLSDADGQKIIVMITEGGKTRKIKLKNWDDVQEKLKGEPGSPIDQLRTTLFALRGDARGGLVGGPDASQGILDDMLANGKYNITLQSEATKNDVLGENNLNVNYYDTYQDMIFWSPNVGYYVTNNKKGEEEGRRSPAMTLLRSLYLAKKIHEDPLSVHDIVGQNYGISLDVNVAIENISFDGSGWTIGGGPKLRFNFDKFDKLQAESEGFLNIAARLFNIYLRKEQESTTLPEDESDYADHYYEGERRLPKERNYSRNEYRSTKSTTTETPTDDE